MGQRASNPPWVGRATKAVSASSPVNPRVSHEKMIIAGGSKDNLHVLRMFSSTTKPKPESYPLVNGALATPAPLAPPAPLVAPSAAPAPEPLSMTQLVDDHFDFVWRLLRRLGLPAPDADDAAQQVFLLACTKQDQIRRGSERSFLYGCALNWSARYRSSVKKRVSHVEFGDTEHELVELDASDPEALLSAHQSRAILDELLEQLPLELRTTLVLYELEQMTSQEIADFAGIPRGTVASRLRKAREEFERLAKRYVAHNLAESTP